MVHDFFNPSDPTKHWVDFYKYDNAGRLILHAYPSAILPDQSSPPKYYDDTFQEGASGNYASDLMKLVNGSYAYLSNSAGLIETTTYYTDTTATENQPGHAAGYVQYTLVQLGQVINPQYPPVPQTSTDYFAHTGGGTTIYPVADTTVYGLDHGTATDYSDRHPRTTTYAYSWYSGSTQMQSMAVTQPVVAPTQNGPPTGTVATTTTFYDAFGRPTWTKDAGGFVGYTAYDQATGAAIKTISDVDYNKLTMTEQTDFVNTTGWTPPTGGLHLVTLMQVDTLGRTTKLTDPKGNITYTVYLDASHAVRTYHGWVDPVTSPPYTTGPTEISQEVWPAAGTGNPVFEETLTASTSPQIDANRQPTGGETILIGDIQSWSRQYTNNAGQVVRTDTYFNKTGIAQFTPAPYLPVNNPGQSANYYTSYTDYDSRGRANRQVSATGTISATVYDGLNRELSTWVGTNDTTTTQVNLSSAFSQNGRTGITTDGVAFTGGGLDGHGYAYSGTLLSGTVTWNRLPFALGPVGANNAVVGSSQPLTLPAGNDTALSLLATAVNGYQQNQTFTITYTDGSTQNFTQWLSDWTNPQNYAGEARAVTMAYRNKADGTTDNSQSIYLYAYSFALDPTRQVQSLTLPNNPNVVLLAATLTNAVWTASNNTAPSNMVQLTANAYDGNGMVAGVGDSTLTQATQYVVANDLTTARVTQNLYDWRDRLVLNQAKLLDIG
jgi:hypothetical protein